MSNEIRTWKLEVTCFAGDVLRTDEHVVESTGIPHPHVNNTFLTWHGLSRVISYNAMNVHNWRMEEVVEGA